MHDINSALIKSINYNTFSDAISGILKEKCFKYIGILFILYVTPIILSSNYYYHDDMCRAISGDAGWSRDGRPIGNLFYQIFSFGKPLAIDVYPLPLIVALFFLTLVLVLLYRRFGNNRPWIFSLCTFPIIASPPFLDNLRWRFDSAFMVLSLVFAIFPYVKAAKDRLFFCVGVVSLICAACSYQPALNVFIGAAALEGYYNLLVVRNITKSLQGMALRIAQFVMGVLIYVKLITPFLSLGEYYNSSSRILPFDAEFFSKLFTNLLSILHLPNILLQGSGMPMIYGILCIAFLIITLNLLTQYYDEEKPSSSKKVAVILFLAVQCITAGMVALAGVMMFNVHPRLEPRVYLGWGMFISFLLLPYCWIKTKHLLVWILVPCLCTFVSFTLNFAVNNASKEEYKYRHNLALCIIKDLDLLKLNDQRLTIVGKPAAAPTTRSLIKTFPFIRKLVDRSYEREFLYINGNGYCKYAPNLSKEQVVEMEKLTPLHVTPHYKFYQFNDAIVIHFSENMLKS